MDLYHYATSEYCHPSHQNHTLNAINAIVDFRYLAPAKLGLDEAHERMRVKAVLRAFGDGNEPTAARPQLTDSVRQCLGDILIQIGTRLQGAHEVTTTSPATSGPGPVTA